jgi:hypothetical protein
MPSSRPPNQNQPPPGTVSKFITPFASLLTALTARLYDLGEPDPDPNPGAGNVSIMEERVSSSHRDEESGVEGGRHGREILCMVGVGFFAVVVMVLCLFFEGMWLDS